MTAALKPIIEMWKQNGTLELEGRLVENRATVCQLDYNKLLDMLRGLKYQEKKTGTVDKSYGTVRHSVSFDGKHVESMTKKKLGHLEIDLPDTGFGIRFSLKAEILTRLDHADEKRGPDSVRIKKRTTFVYNKEFNFDLTQVQSGRTEAEASNVGPSYEVEVEALRVPSLQKERSSIVAIKLLRRFFTLLHQDQATLKCEIVENTFPK